MLSTENITQLLNQCMHEAKIATLQAMLDVQQSIEFYHTDNRIADTVSGLLSHDVELLVRIALVETLKSATPVPRDLAISIAHDVSLVSVSFVSITQALSATDFETSGLETDLLAAQQGRMAGGPFETYGMAAENLTTMVNAVMHPQAEAIHEAVFQDALHKFGDVRIAHAMAIRSMIPLGVAQNLIGLVIDSIRMKLITKYDLSDAVVAKLIWPVRDKTSLMLINPATSMEEVQQLVAGLHDQGFLTDSLIYLSLEQGLLPFFEWALSQRSSVRHKSVQALVRDRGTMGLLAICRKAGIDERFYQSMRLEVGIAYDIDPVSVDETYRVPKNNMNMTDAEMQRQKEAIFKDEEEQEEVMEIKGWTDLTS